MKRFWQIGNILSLLFALVANAVVGAQLLPLPAINEISDKYITLLTPATYAFSIWSVIYTYLVIFALYQARDIFKPSKDNKLPEKIGPFFIVANICNGLWTYLFVTESIGLSVVVISILAISLYILLHNLWIAVYDARARTIAFVWWPLLIYTGWVTVATVVNYASAAKAFGFVITPLLAIIVICALAAALLLLLWKRNVRELLLASAWGIIAIGVRQLQASESAAVAIAALLTGMVLLTAVGVHAYVNRQSNPFFKKFSNNH